MAGKRGYVLIPARRNPGGKVVPIRMKNVAAGFMDEDGIFHPIRASFDYSPSRAGEGRSRPKKKRR